MTSVLVPPPPRSSAPLGSPAAPSPPPRPTSGTRQGRMRLRARFSLAARLVLAVAGIAVSYLIDSEIFAPVISLFVFLLPLEKLYPRQKGQKVRRPLVATDISFALMGPLLNVVGLTAGVVIAGLSASFLCLLRASCGRRRHRSRYKTGEWV